MPSLKHITFVKIAITLWNEDDEVLNLMSKFYHIPSAHFVVQNRNKWQDIEDKVIKKVLNLPLPEKSRKELSYFIGAVGLQIRAWKEYHNNILDVAYLRKHLSKLFWTTQGTVDKEKTAEVLVDDESLDIRTRYDLACTYCFEDRIHVLWKQLPNVPYEYDLRYILEIKPFIVSYWSHYVAGEISQLVSKIDEFQRDRGTSYAYPLQRSVVSGNESATRYFIQKFSPQEKKEYLVISAQCVAWDISEMELLSMKPTMDVFRFLLSQMDAEQQMQVFRRFPYEVLSCFLDWPWQHFLMEIVNNMWDFLPEEVHYRFFSSIVRSKVMDDDRFFNYRRILEEFWHQSPNAYRRNVITRCVEYRSLLAYLFEVEDKETIKMIFKDAISVEREYLIFCSAGQMICHNLVYHSKWELLKFFIQECISSKYKIMKFKENFKKFVIWLGEDLARTEDKWCTFFQLLDDFVEKDFKKNSVETEEGDTSQAKRFCSVRIM